MSWRRSAARLPTLSKFISKNSIEERLHRAYMQDEGHRHYLQLIWHAMYPHFILDHINYESFKIVFRTWFQMWTTLLLTIIYKPADWLGSLAYFINVGGVVELSGGISISQSIFVGVLNVAFTCYAVLCAAVANAISWRIRHCPSKAQIFTEIYDEGLCIVGDATCATDVIYGGKYLQTTTTVIHVLSDLICLATAGYATIKARFLTATWVIIALTLAVGTSSTVLLPYFDPWQTGRNIVVPIGISSAARFFYSCTIFPTTSATKLLITLRNTARSVRELSREMFDAQKQYYPSNPEFGKVMPSYATKVSLLRRSDQSIEMDRMLNKFEISYGRFDSDEINELRDRIIMITNTFPGFQFFYNELYTRKTNIIENDRRLRRYETAGSDSDKKREADPVRKYKYKRVGKFENDKRQKNINWHWKEVPIHPLKVADVDELYKNVTRHYQTVLYAGEETLQIITSWLEIAIKVNFRAFIFPGYARRCMLAQQDCSENLSSALGRMQKAREALDESRTAHRTFADPNSNLYKNHLAYFLEQDAYYGFVTTRYVARITRLAQHCLFMDRERPCARWIIPFKDGSIFRRMFKGRDNSLETVDDLGDIKNELVRSAPKISARNPDSSPPTSWWHFIGSGFLQFHRWVSSPDLVFVIKRAVLVVCGLAPGYFRPTAAFFYSHRLGWVSALIALAVSQNAADGVYGFVMRLAFSLFGCTAAMVAWYICAGSGTGNPYGYAAVMAVVIAYVAFHRHFSHHMNSVSSIVLGLTVVIVLGASWVQANHAAPYYHLAPGFNIAWIRFVCVVIGLSIAFIGTIFPHAYTAKKSIRIVLGGTLTELSDLQAHIINFAIQRYETPEVHANSKDIVDKKVKNLIARMNLADRLKSALKYEPALGGVWPSHRYALMIQIQREVIYVYWLIYLTLDAVKIPQKVPSLLRRLGWTNADIIQSIYSLLYMVSRALVEGEALPVVTPGYLSEMHLWELRRRLLKDQKRTSDNVIARMYIENDGQLSMAAMLLGRLLYERLDGIMMLAKGLVGESFDTDIRFCDMFGDSDDEETEKDAQDVEALLEQFGP